MGRYCWLGSLALFLVLVYALPREAIAGTYWVSPEGKATWADAESSTPLGETACTSLSSANTNATAGDTINMRAGIYNTTIAPANSGKAGKVITYQAFNKEKVVITNTAPYATYQFGIRLRGNDYIRVDGVTTRKPLSRHLTITHGAQHNEITSCTFVGAAIAFIWDGQHKGGNPCTHNWIHGCTFAGLGYVNAKGDDCGGFQVGVPRYDNHSNHTTIEDNVFYGGGHHNLETYTEYNVIRNNVFHNEGSMAAPNPAACRYAPDTNGLYGNRNIQIYDGHNRDGVFNLIESNRFGHSGPPPDDDGGDGMTITAPKNIIRHNDVFNSQNNGVYFKAGAGSYSNNNRFFNNTIYKSGRYRNGKGQWQGSNIRDPGIYAWRKISSIEGVDGTVTLVVTSPASWVTGSLVTISGTANYNGLNRSVAKVNDTTFTYSKAGTYAKETSGSARGGGPKLGNVVKNNILYSYGTGGRDWALGNKTESYGTYTNNWGTDKDGKCSGNGDPLFVNTDVSDPTSLTLPDLSLKEGSGAIDAGTHLTNAVGSGTDNATLVVGDALYFQDGTWGSDLARNVTLFPDWIAIGSVSNVVQIQSIDYETNTIVLKSPVTWDKGAKVWLYKDSSGRRVLYGSAPDIGAHERDPQPRQQPKAQTHSK